VNPRRLYRSADDRILAGVAGGVAAYFDVDPVIVRIIWFLSVFFTGSLTFWAYLVMIVVVPLEPSEWPAQSPWAPGGGPAGYAATYTPPVATGPIDPATGAPVAGEPGTAAPFADPNAGAGAGPNATPAGPNAAPGTPPPAGPAQAGWWGYDWRSQRRQERWQRRAERWQQRADGREYRGYGGPGLVFGLLLILVGGMLAWHQYDPNFDLNLTWPVVAIAFGAILVVSSLRFRGR
jgi:phage shock protein PspC (stress-responsive transcriptional regulator)